MNETDFTWGDLKKAMFSQLSARDVKFFYDNLPMHLQEMLTNYANSKGRVYCVDMNYMCYSVDSWNPTNKPLGVAVITDKVKILIHKNEFFYCRFEDSVESAENIANACGGRVPTVDEMELVFENISLINDAFEKMRCRQLKRTTYWCTTPTCVRVRHLESNVVSVLPLRLNAELFVVESVARIEGSKLILE